MVFFVLPPQAQASPQAPSPEGEGSGIEASPSPSKGGDVPNPTYMLSFVSNYIQYIFLLYHISKTYVIEKYVALSFHLKLMSLNNMFFCHFVSKSHVLLSHTKAPPR